MRGAVIDNGGDFRHEDLQNVLWTNSDEIPNNGIDDDRNGYVDDIHGWNFQGRPDGTNFAAGNTEGDRFFLKWGKAYFLGEGRLSKAKRTYFEEKVIPCSNLAKRWIQSKQFPEYPGYVEDFCEYLQQDIEKHDDSVFPVFPVYIARNLHEELRENDSLKKDEIRYGAYYYFATKIRRINNEQLERLKEYLFDSLPAWNQKDMAQLKQDIEHAQALEYSLHDPATGKLYPGNPRVNDSTALHGTHVGGIIGGDRHDGNDYHGIADVKLMYIRLLAGSGSDERDEQVAAAIRYAVDNGANIINMSFGKFLSTDPKAVRNAIKHARKKGVLLVTGAGNEADNLDLHPRSPQCYGYYDNLIVVGASDPRGESTIFSNFGKQSVHLFAPGVQINSAIPGNKHKECSGTSMASPVVAGVAALIWNYFPTLTAAEIKQILIETSIPAYESTISCLVAEDTYEDLPFHELSVSGKIVNAAQAVRRAAEIAAEKSLSR